jgi:hypothetical protein
MINQPPSLEELLTQARHLLQRQPRARRHPNGSNDGWRGLVFSVREFAPGFWAECLAWVRAEHVRPL